MDTLTRPLLRGHRFARQSNMGHFALLVCAFEPSPTQLLLARGLEQLPKEYVKAALQGLELGLQGFACQVQLLDGVHHETDSRVGDFERVGMLLANEILREPRGPLPAVARSAKLVRKGWNHRWLGFQSKINRELEARLSPLGFQLTDKGLERSSEGLHQTLSLKGNSPNLPSAIDLRMQLSFSNSRRELGHLSLARHSANLRGSKKSTLWRLEDETSESELLASLDLNWLVAAATPRWLVANRPAGLYWWSPIVEARLLALAGKNSEARDIARQGVEKRRGRLGHAVEIRDLEGLLTELS